ncbi:glycine cleavage system protein H [Desulfobacula phenolica]|uniref:Glycine cleavage system H protein (Lipoate-binding) n=1 Tax=Desulfobacula phenolica TaxID=90732 RepID=A0A1H2DNX1_9BACT|nr:glycine cleavage system protein H [Desulfobacula phenolica]SDT84431.1 Glycine cleavage system H protein (lipoate-binding) [Desulfobacula phenolica]
MKIALKQASLPDCLWMQAGVVPKKHCYKNFCCITCQFDRAMTRVCRKNKIRQNKTSPQKIKTIKSKRENFIFWKDRLRQMPLAGRPCVHHMKGHIEFKTCPKSYHCTDCEFDQYFHDQFTVHTVLKPVAFDDINGICLPTGYYLHSGHTWIKLEGQGMVRAGIDDFACRLLGKFDTFADPLMGKQLKQGLPAVTLSRQKHKVDFLSPVNGVITQVNAKVKKKPGLINQSPYTDGWLFMLYCPDLKQDLKQLMFMKSSKGFMGQEVKRLTAFIEEETQAKAADGGSFVSDLFGNLPGVSWEDLLKRFIPQGT